MPGTDAVVGSPPAYIVRLQDSRCRMERSGAIVQRATSYCRPAVVAIAQWIVYCRRTLRYRFCTVLQ